MKEIILPTGLYGESFEFSLDNLRDIINDKCINPVEIKLEFWDLDENTGTMAVSIFKETKHKLNSASVIYVFLFDLQNEYYKKYLEQCYLVKKFLKKSYPKIRVLSNFR